MTLVAGRNSAGFPDSGTDRNAVNGIPDSLVDVRVETIVPFKNLHRISQNVSTLFSGQPAFVKIGSVGLADLVTGLYIQPFFFCVFLQNIVDLTAGETLTVSGKDPFVTVSVLIDLIQNSRCFVIDVYGPAVKGLCMRLNAQLVGFVTGRSISGSSRPFTYAYAITRDEWKSIRNDL